MTPNPDDIRGAMRGHDPHPPLCSRFVEFYGQEETCQETGKPCAMYGCPKIAREGKGERG